MEPCFGTRREFRRHGLRLSYLDAGGSGRLMIALHAHWMEASTFVPLAAALQPDWQVVALDQRGHGNSDHAATYSRDDYLNDLQAFLDHLEVRAPVVLLGNSLGGVNAYQFAARYPERVRALIVEDIGAVLDGDPNMALAWEGTFNTEQALEEKIGPRLTPYLRPSFRKTEAGWKLAFDPRDIARSEANLHGDHWQDWLTSSCPALLIRGEESRVTSQEHLEEMARRRPHTTFRSLPGGHVVHASHPQQFVQAVRTFLQEL
jgi:pimeloyl-ACP methyl ester carboxylesterase